MITVLLHLFRLCPFLFGGRRQLALENRLDGHRYTGEPSRLAPATGGVQTGREPAEATADRWPVLGGPVQVVDRLEENARDRSPGHCHAVAAPPLPRTLDQALSPPPGGPPAGQCPDRRAGRPDGQGQSPVGRPANPR